MVLYGFLAFLIARELRPALQLSVALGAAALIFAIAFSRLYLGAHWFSDVVGGAAFGSAWLILLGLFYLRRPVERIGSPALLVAASVALLLAGGGNIYRSHATDVERYAAKSVTQITAVADWWATGWQTLPERRIDLTGEVEEPLTFQWAGSLQDLGNILQRNGWGPSIGWTPATALKWLTASTDAADVPVVPLFASGRLPYLTFVRSADTTTAAGSRLVLRLWATDLGVTDGQTVPLWIGSVTEERVYRPFSLIALVSTQPDFNAPRQTLAQSFEGGGLVARAVEQTNLKWDGRVLLAHQKWQKKIAPG